MSTATPEITAFDRALRPFLDILLPGRAQEVIDLEPDPALRERIDELAARSTEDELDEFERAEYEGHVRANKIVAILKREARRLLEAS